MLKDVFIAELFDGEKLRDIEIQPGFELTGIQKTQVQVLAGSQCLFFMIYVNCCIAVCLY